MKDLNHRQRLQVSFCECDLVRIICCPPFFFFAHICIPTLGNGITAGIGNMTLLLKSAVQPEPKYKTCK